MMQQTGLELVPIERLIEEIKRRSEVCVVAYTRTEDPGSPLIYFTYETKQSWMDVIALCEDVKFEVLSDRRKMRDEE